MMRRLLTAIHAPFAALALVLAFVVVCLVVICGPTQTIRRELGRAGVRFALACAGVRIHVSGLQRLPSGANIVVANHASYLDGLVLTAALPRRYSFVVQDGAASWPLVGLTIRRMGVVFVNRAEARAGARITRLLMRRLQREESLAMFAEGTFKPEPGLLPFKNGAFIMAARTGAQVVPVGIRGTRRLYGGGRRLPRWSRVEIEVGTPVRADGSDREAALRLRDAARAQVLGLCGEPDRHAPATDPEV